MLTPFSTGFFLGLSLIVAIGAQNTFVLRQGILKQHIFLIALFCSISDSLLIILGILGISYFLNDFIYEYLNIIYGFTALWLFLYGVLRLRSIFISKSKVIANNNESRSLSNAISIVAIFTFANPHVYLDTMILIGSISQQYVELSKLYFAIGACSASFVWFFSLAYGAQFITPIMKNSNSWRILDCIIAIIMFTIAFQIASQGNWL